MQNEKNKRLEILYRKHNDWLRACTWNICGNEDMVDELVSELYAYLAEKGNEKLYYLDSYNLGYCRSFLKTRFINKIKIENRYTNYDMNEEVPEEVYNEEYDKLIDSTHAKVKEFLKSKLKTDNWVSAKIAELYYFGKGFTIESLANEIGVSKSTVFLHLKSIRKEIKNNIENPFDTNEDE